MDWFDGTMLINIGAVCYIIAFAIRGELSLRALTLLGNIFYIIYYLYVPEVTLWFAIISTTLMTIANIVVIARIIFERTTWRMSDDDKALYSQFGNFNPGQFRRLLKTAQIIEADQPVTLLSENQLADHLFFISKGEAHVMKDGRVFTLPSHNFVGEIAWLLGCPAAANVTAQDGAQLLAWQGDTLRALCEKWPDIDNALRARINQDLARKLAQSVQA